LECPDGEPHRSGTSLLQSDFDSMQVSAHKDAVSLFERYAKGGDNSDLKDGAGNLKHHLEMAQGLDKAR
jgi:putative membrane protein